MRVWKKVALAIGLVGIAAGSIAWGGKAARRHFGHYMIGAKIEQALDDIDATPQQRETVRQARVAIQDKLRAQRDAHRGTHDEIAALLAADKLDSGKLLALVDAKADAAKAAAREIVPEIAKVHDALTPAQRAKLYERFKEMKARHEQRRGPRGGFGGEE